MQKRSKIYVAGHKGLVGSAIWNTLLARGYNAVIGKNFEELDLMDAVAVKRFFDEEQPEYVILAAAKVGGILSNNTYRADYIYQNLQIQQNIIGESFRHNVKKLLFLGSTCIYPKEANQPMKEEELLTGHLEYTNEPYAIAKIAGLKMCESFNLQYGTNYIAVMPTNLYGPNDNFDLGNGHVIPAMIRKIYLGKCLQEENWKAIRNDFFRLPVEGVTGKDSESTIKGILAKHGVFNSSVELWGTGKPMREFLWSEEMADASIFIMEHVNFEDLKGDSSEVRNCHINIGTGEEISIKDLSETIANIIEYTGTICFNPDKPDGAMRKLADSSKLNSLGWRHSIAIEEGVKKLFNWYVS